MTGSEALIYFLTEWEDSDVKRSALLEVVVCFWTSKMILIILISPVFQNLARALFSSLSSFRHSWLSHRA